MMSTFLTRACPTVGRASSRTLKVPAGALTFGKTAAVAIRPSRTSTCRFCVQAATSQEKIATENAPAALGPYSQAIKAGDTLYVSGQLGIVPGASGMIGDDVESQADQALKNLGAILTAAGSSYEKVVKVTVLLADINDFAAINKIYAGYFPPAGSPPARMCYAVKSLPFNAKFEMDAIALV